MSEAIAEAISQLATKQDLTTAVEIAKRDIKIWVGGLLIAATTIILAAIGTAAGVILAAIRSLPHG